MKTLRTAVPIVLIGALVSGCATVQKEDWPTCAAIGGVTGAALGTIESSTYAGWGALLGGGIAAAYCWAQGQRDSDGDGVPDDRDKCPNTARGVQVDAQGCPLSVAAAVVEEVPVAAPVAQPRQETIVVNDLLFAFDSAELQPRDRQSLDEVISRLRRERSDVRLTVVGHTDSVGADAYNQRLSMQRARAVADYLVANGISRQMIGDVRGVGESQPVASNETERGRQLNRRVEVIIDR